MATIIKDIYTLAKMVSIVGITKAITNLNEAHTKLNLSQTTDNNFFTEWFEDLPILTDSEKESLNRLKIAIYITLLTVQLQKVQSM